MINKNENFNKKKILNAISKANKRGKGDGGNCGMFVYGVYKWLKDHGIETYLCLLCDSDTGEDCENLEDVYTNDALIYHCFLWYDGNFYDNFGSTSQKEIMKISTKEYGDDSPIFFSVKNKTDENLYLQIIKNQTSWNISWEEFYKSIK